MKAIPLTQGKTALVDNKDYLKLKDFTWFYHNGYATRTDYINKKTKTVLMHSIILDTPKNMMSDHINGDKLDNRRSNLRIVTSSQNQMNRKKARAKSGYKGVYWQPQLNKWFAAIYKGKSIHIGYFEDAKLAAKAYNIKALELFGSYASLNNI